MGGVIQELFVRMDGRTDEVVAFARLGCTVGVISPARTAGIQRKVTEMTHDV
jgi:hypothetical protein